MSGTIRLTILYIYIYRYIYIYAFIRVLICVYHVEWAMQVHSHSAFSTFDSIWFVGNSDETHTIFYMLVRLYSSKRPANYNLLCMPLFHSLSLRASSVGVLRDATDLSTTTLLYEPCVCSFFKFSLNL